MPKPMSLRLPAVLLALFLPGSQPLWGQDGPPSFDERFHFQDGSEAPQGGPGEKSGPADTLKKLIVPPAEAAPPPEEGPPSQRASEPPAADPATETAANPPPPSTPGVNPPPGAPEPSPPTTVGVNPPAPPPAGDPSPPTTVGVNPPGSPPGGDPSLPTTVGANPPAPAGAAPSPPTTVGVYPPPRPRLKVAAKPKVRRIAVGRASYYEHPGRTASGEKYNPNQLTAAHKSLPIGTRLRVVNLRNRKSVVVRVNDRSPRKMKFVIDLSRGSARAIGISRVKGVARVAVYTVE